MRTGRAVLSASVVYIAAWLIGLFAAPPRPTAGGAGATREYFLDHGGAAIAQSLLVHGLAGLALAVFAVALGRLLAATSPDTAISRTVMALGGGAALLSLVQVALLLSVATRAGSLADQVAADRVHWIDYVDVAKLVLIAAFAVLGTRAAAGAGLVSSWVVPVAVALALLLLSGGLSLVVDNGILTGALFVSLPLLLVWAGIMGVSVQRGAPAEAASATEVSRR